MKHYFDRLTTFQRVYRDIIINQNAAENCVFKKEKGKKSRFQRNAFVSSNYDCERASAIKRYIIYYIYTKQTLSSSGKR